MNKINQAGIDLVKKWEGLRLEAYKDLVGIWTVGYGHTGAEVHPGLTWSVSQANMALIARLNAISSILSQGCIVPMLNENQFSALVCLCYNIGQSAFRGSTLLKLINTRQFDDLEAEWVKWDHAGGKVVPGLLARRKEEVKLFNMPPESSLYTF